MILEKLLETLSSVEEKNTYLYFVTRNLKPDIKKTDKALNKYEFGVYQIDIDNDIRKHLYEITYSQLFNQTISDEDITDYDVYTDEANVLYIYQMTNKSMPFGEVVNNLKTNTPKIVNLDELVKDEELWAYCVGLYSDNENWIYTFRKILPSKVAIDEKEGNQKNIFQKALRTIFNTKSSKLELIEGDTINLDKQVDCFYFQDIFYIMRKTQFEQIVGLQEEFKIQAYEVIDDLEGMNIIDDISFLRSQLDANPYLHKKFVRLSKIGNYKEVDGKLIKKMKDVAKKFGHKLKLKNNKIIIEDNVDLNMTLKLFADYYKEGVVSGKSYGTYAGKQID